MSLLSMYQCKLFVASSRFHIHHAFIMELPSRRAVLQSLNKSIQFLYQVRWHHIGHSNTVAQ